MKTTIAALFCAVLSAPAQYLGHPTTVLLEDKRTMLIVMKRSRREFRGQATQPRNSAAMRLNPRTD